MSDIIFGPILSRRFGKSLGIDLSPSKKQCNYDCLYCELSPAKTMTAQDEVVEINDIIDAVQKSFKEHPDIDVLTITANGEPTLYPHIKELVEKLNELKGNTKTLILSNGSTISDPAIQDALLDIDIVKLSLDCATQKCIRKIDRMDTSIDVEQIKKGMLEFADRYQGSLIMEVLLVKGVNDKPAETEALNEFFKLLKPDRIDLGTIDRPPAYKVEPVDYQTLRELSMLFDPSLDIHITQRKGLKPSPQNYSPDEILTTISKRPLTPEDVEILFDKTSQNLLKQMVENGDIKIRNNQGVDFFTIGQKNN